MEKILFYMQDVYRVRLTTVALFTNSSSIYKVPGALPDFGKTIYMENIERAK